jgi:hypothetical protein
MIFINRLTLQQLQELLEEYCKDTEIVGMFFDEMEAFAYGEENFKTRMTSRKYLSYLKEFDTLLSDSIYPPDWDYYEPHSNLLPFDEERVGRAFDLLKEEGDLFHLFVLVCVFVGGCEDTALVPTFSEYLKGILKDIKSYITAKKMEREFSQADVLKAVSYTHLAEPVDVSAMPPYLLNSSGVVTHGGKYYLTDDIIKALTASGGVAQALERQDLEGGITNAAEKRTRTKVPHGQKHDSDDSTDASSEAAR